MLDMNKKLSVRASLIILASSIVVAFSPIIYIAVSSMFGSIDTTPVPGGMSEADGVFVYMFFSIPLGGLLGAAGFVSLIQALIAKRRSNTTY